MNELKLCYVDLPWCYFTTKELSEQWGDDWNDAPYEHNAGTPYRPCWHREGGKACDCESCKRDWNDDGTPKFEIKKVSIDGCLEQPCDGHFNSPYSVEMINRGDVPWLKTPDYEKKQISIMAGTSLEKFIELVKAADGEIYLEAA